MNTVTASSAQQATRPAPTDRRSALRDRLGRLEAMLLQDPANPNLRIDAFETALACGEWDSADALLARALQDGRSEDALGWQLRRGDLWLAQGEHERARAVYEGLVVPEPAPVGLREVLLHNLAYIDFVQGRHGQAVERLAPVLEATGGAPQAPAALAAAAALQRLWLRALHHGAELPRALAWMQAHAKAVGGDASVLGVASLVALDAEDFERARQWAGASVAPRADGWRSPEGLVAVSSLALYGGDIQVALGSASEAVQRAPSEGRAWSALAFAQMFARAFDAAQVSFTAAVERMPLHIGTWHGLGWTQLMLGDRQAALGTFLHALALDRTFAESHGAVAVVYALAGQHEEARAAAALALRLDASNLSGRYAEALLSGEAADQEKMQRLVRRLLEGRRHQISGMGLADWMQAQRGPGA
ncbi:MAG: hypothetical protein REJ50_27290 [Bordetella sp.]|nr:hypothetical protein [Bordetella sp.]